MMHLNPVAVANGTLTVDRKFHVGMLNYVKHLECQVTTMNPLQRAGQAIMDPVEVPLGGLPYRIEALQLDEVFKPDTRAQSRMREIIGASHLLYGSASGSAQLARELGVRYVSVMEYDLETQIVVDTAGLDNLARRAVRTAKRVLNYYTVQIQDIKGAHSVHCNGFPTFEVARRYNANALLYLDSRMSQDMIISDHELMRRCLDRTRRPLRLLYSGRYERLKGAEDAVRTGLECLRLGLDVEMHCYGQGSLNEVMRALAAQRPDRIHVHDAIPYPELVTVARTFDVFVCCHIQNDPSCTYLESFGAGLPIAGYANRMWHALHAASQAGVVSPIGKYALLAQAIGSSTGELTAMSRRAVAFAREHTLEREFKKRADALNRAADLVAAPVPGA